MAGQSTTDQQDCAALQLAHVHHKLGSLVMISRPLYQTTVNHKENNAKQQCIECNNQANAVKKFYIIGMEKEI